LEKSLRYALVAEKICDVDRSDAKTIQNPYGNQPTATIGNITGTYDISNYNTTDDTLTVNNEVKYAEHVYEFENLLSNFDMFAARTDEQAYAIAYQIDYFVLNNLCEDGTGTYSTPTGGFTTAANINTIMANLYSKFIGYAEAFYKGLFLVIEAGDTVGFTVAQATNGFSVSDSALQNGLYTKYMGFDIYVVKNSTFVSDTIGTTTVTNDGHRVAGVKGVATYAAPRGLKVEEKAVSGKTGMEVVTYAYVGFKLWTPKAGLIVDITITT
jgi:hypothetical protein